MSIMSWYVVTAKVSLLIKRKTLFEWIIDNGNIKIDNRKKINVCKKSFSVYNIKIGFLVCSATP